MRPMLATAADPKRGLPDDGSTWAYEPKWDGMRILADVRDGVTRLYSRTERDVTVAFPELARLGAGLGDVLLDGEIVVLAAGIPSFAALADRFHVTDARRAATLANQAPASLIAFDVLRAAGQDLTGRPWTERREVLSELEGLQVSPVHDELAPLFEATKQHGLEGVVAKRRTSRYHPGVRSPDWLKLAHRRTATCLIGGWRPESGGGRTRIGALLLAAWSAPDAPGPHALHFRGRVGSGLTSATAQATLKRLLTPLAADAPPFAHAVPRLDAAGAVWVRPELAIEVRFLGRTENGRLRQPVYLGIRADVEPGDVTD